MLNTKDVREILAGYDIMTVMIESKDGRIAEGFKYAPAKQDPYNFVLIHNGTAISMINALSAYLRSEDMRPGSNFDRDAIMQLNDASDALAKAARDNAFISGISA